MTISLSLSYGIYHPKLPGINFPEERGHAQGTGWEHRLDGPGVGPLAATSSARRSQSADNRIENGIPAIGKLADRTGQVMVCVQKIRRENAHLISAPLEWPQDVGVPSPATQNPYLQIILIIQSFLHNPSPITGDQRILKVPDWFSRPIVSKILMAQNDLIN